MTTTSLKYFQIFAYDAVHQQVKENHLNQWNASPLPLTAPTSEWTNNGAKTFTDGVLLRRKENDLIFESHWLENTGLDFS